MPVHRSLPPYNEPRANQHPEMMWNFLPRSRTLLGLARGPRGGADVRIEVQDKSDRLGDKTEVKKNLLRFAVAREEGASFANETKEGSRMASSDMCMCLQTLTLH